jgi:hypothetical protein
MVMKQMMITMVINQNLTNDFLLFPNVVTIKRPILAMEMSEMVFPMLLNLQTSQQYLTFVRIRIDALSLKDQVLLLLHIYFTGK